MIKFMKLVMLVVLSIGMWTMAANRQVLATGCNYNWDCPINYSCQNCNYWENGVFITSCCHQTCSPSCAGKCGGASDGCSGRCWAACASCTPNCSGDQCGQSNGCAGSCGSGDRGTCGKCGNAACQTSSGCQKNEWGGCSGGVDRCVTRSKSDCAGGGCGCYSNDCSDGSTKSCAVTTPGPTTTPPPSNCTGVNYVLNPVSPENPTTNIGVNYDRCTASMGDCGINNVGYELDGVRQYNLSLSRWDGSNCPPFTNGAYHSNINTGAPGTHTLQFTTNNGACKCNAFTFITNSPTCSVGIVAPANITKGTSDSVQATITTQNGATINGFTSQMSPVISNVTLTPASGVVSPASIGPVGQTFNVAVGISALAGAFQVVVNATTAQGVSCSGTSTPISIIDPSTKFFSANGGDVIVNDSLGTNFPTTIPAPYFIDKAGAADASAGMAFGLYGSGWYGNLTPSSANVNQWLVDIGTGGWNSILAKGENSYATMKIRLLNKVISPATINNTQAMAAAFSQVAAANTVNGVEIVQVTGGDWNINSAVNIGANKVIFLVDSNVNIKGTINRGAGGFLAIFARGNITVDGTVGSTDADITSSLMAPHLLGIFYAGNIFDAGSSNINRLKINGTVIGMGGVNLAGRTAKGVKPTIYFNFKPDLTATLNGIGLRQKVFEELQAP